MSRVTIRELLYECNQPMGPEDFVKMQKILDIEITPRRAIEMIIAKCEKEICTDYKSVAAIAEASLIKRYAEELLENFEEDPE